MTDIIALSKQVEALTSEGDLIRLLEEAASKGLLWSDAYSGWTRFLELTGVRAFLEAAATLVPPNDNISGELYNVEAWHSNGVHAAHIRATAWVYGAERTYAATPALALAAAAIRALGYRANLENTND